MSASANGGSTGGRSPKPFLEAKPDIASTSVPKPGRSRYGPSCPNPVTRTMISFGLRACIVNFRTTLSDVEALPEIVVRLGRQLDSEMRPKALRG